METKFFTDFLEMCQAIADHTTATGHNVLPADEVTDPPYIGYLAFERNSTGESDTETSVLFKMLVSDVEPSLRRAEQGPTPEVEVAGDMAWNNILTLNKKQTPPDEGPDSAHNKAIKAALIRQCLMTGEGRIRLACAFPGQKIDNEPPPVIPLPPVEPTEPEPTKE